MPVKKSADNWIIRENGFKQGAHEHLGSKLLIGNGYLGYRGTLEEYSKKELVACTLSGIYDRHGDAWREPINAPNGLFVELSCQGRRLNPLDFKPRKHKQSLDIRHGVHSRDTIFALPKGQQICIQAERFASMADPHLLGLCYTIRASKAASIRLRSGIDADVWDINGPHFRTCKFAHQGTFLTAVAMSSEGKTIAVAETVQGLPEIFKIRRGAKSIVREWTLKLKAGEEICFTKFAAIATNLDHGWPLALAQDSLMLARQQGYDRALNASAYAWDRRWNQSDVAIEGDPVAQEALRFSIYHLLSIAPSHSDKASIPARGLSGQVYKGAIFWDTEMFMLPFFNATQPHSARNLVRYRFHTLDGARRKAKSLGYRGAFYAWESQESGDEACTLFNITDILTGRPLRTYFADKQIHISADVAHGIWQYFLMSGDESLLWEGGAEVILECARFFASYAYFKPDKGRYEMLDVTGPDEYHERVHNNAFSSAMAWQTISTALELAKLLGKKQPGNFARLIKKLNFKKDLEVLEDMKRRLYVPGPDPKTGVIEQFDGYHKLEKIGIKELKSKLLNPKEYLGGGQGLATSTQVIKQADVMTLLHTLGRNYSAKVKKANWEFYEPRTEHGSSLSPCIYALVAAAIGKTAWAYRYFLKTATVDLTGDAKQYVGSLYIGGTHPAANGGAWMAAVLGFGGLSYDGSAVHIKPQLPKPWKSLSYKVSFKGQRLAVKITPKSTQISADSSNTQAVKIGAKGALCRPGKRISA